MICNFSTKLPNGQPSRFVEKIARAYTVGLIKRPYDKEFEALIDEVAKGVDPILLWSKIHTIRWGKRWRAGMKAHIYTGSRTKNSKCHFVLDVVSVQDVVIIPGGPVLIDGKIISEERLEELAGFDGFLTAEHFFQWFKEPFVDQIIHFTDKRY